MLALFFQLIFLVLFILYYPCILLHLLFKLTKNTMLTVGREEGPS